MKRWKKLRLMSRFKRDIFLEVVSSSSILGRGRFPSSEKYCIRVVEKSAFVANGPSTSPNFLLVYLKTTL